MTIKRWTFIICIKLHGVCICCVKQHNSPSVLWHCWLGIRKSIRPGWWGVSVVICLEWGADLHMAQLMPLPLTVSGFSKIQIGFTFLVPAHPGSPGQGPLNGCACVCCVTQVEQCSVRSRSVSRRVGSELYMNWPRKSTSHWSALSTGSVILSCCSASPKGSHAYYTHIHAQTFNCPLSGTTRSGRYQKKHSPIHIHPDHQTSLSASSIYYDP